MNQREMEWRPDLLERAQRCWEGMSRFRIERERCKRFTYGDQWSDEVPSEFGALTESDYLISQGNIPLTNNLIRRLVRNVLGVFRNQWALPHCVARDPAEQREAEIMDRLLEYNIDRNRMEELYARTMEEFLISGMAVHRKWFGRQGGHSDCHTDFVSPTKFFFDRGSRDFRSRDISIIGEVHDMELEDLCASFARSEEEYVSLYKLYDAMQGRGPGFGGYAVGGTASRSCRVIEVWRKEYIPRHAGERWMMEERWHYYFLTPEGYVLAKGETPYDHGSHPYAVKAYPFIDGEIHSFVSDIIDQQKFTNRLITMYDWILRSSAKGVLLFPEDALPAGLNISDVAKEWSRFNGVIMYKHKDGGAAPQQVHSNLSNLGITDLLAIQMNMMEDISGVNGALQGKLESNSMSGTLYSQQTQNSLTALADMLRTYNDFIAECSAKDISNMRQFYSPQMVSSILGESLPLADRENFFDSSLDFSIRIGKATGGLQTGEERINAH